jgi:hypothetical protein
VALVLGMGALGIGIVSGLLCPEFTVRGVSSVA